jgi:hypothetical protein
MTKSIIENYKSDALQSFRNYKSAAEKALAQVSDEEFFKMIDAESNSLATIVKHIAGNLHSRWTNFLTTDGEKPDRRRDREFVVLAGETRESIMKFWESGWKILFEAIEPIAPEDFGKTVTIRGEPHTIVEAINRQLSHYAQHIGQIIFLAKHFRVDAWHTLSLPKNKSAEFNEFLEKQSAAGKTETNSLESPQEFVKKLER